MTKKKKKEDKIPTITKKIKRFLKDEDFDKDDYLTLTKKELAEFVKNIKRSFKRKYEIIIK